MHFVVLNSDRRERYTSWAQGVGKWATGRKCKLSVLQLHLQNGEDDGEGGGGDGTHALALMRRLWLA